MSRILGDLSMVDMLAPETDVVRVKTVDKSTQDFEKQQTVTGRDVDALLQPADSEQLQNLDGVEYAQRYIQFHSLQPIYYGELIEHMDRDFKVISVDPWKNYGFTQGVAEETKEAQLQETA